tara:strand:- start:238 stop:558 length:321 start_codon:yes stop_codon:yes gene_type:complete
MFDAGKNWSWVKGDRHYGYLLCPLTVTVREHQNGLVIAFLLSELVVGSSSAEAKLRVGKGLIQCVPLVSRRGWRQLTTYFTLKFKKGAATVVPFLRFSLFFDIIYT